MPSSVQHLLEIKDDYITGSKIIDALKDLLNNYYQHPELERTMHKQSIFKNLCLVIDTNVKKLQPTETITILKLLIEMKIPSDSHTVLYLLQQVESAFHNLPYNNQSQVSERSTIIKNNRENKPILDTNEIIYPDSNIKFNNEPSSIYENVDVSSAINDFEEGKLNDISLVKAITIMKGYLDSKKTSPRWHKFLHHLQNIIMDNLHEIKDTEVLYLVLLMKNIIIHK